MKGIKLFVATNLSSQAMTIYPITNATAVAANVSAIENTLESVSDEKALFN